MENFRTVFFQVLLVILAIAFTVCIRYLSESQRVEVGQFGNGALPNITVTDMLRRIERNGAV